MDALERYGSNHAYEDATSPYLNRPTRTIAEVQRDILIAAMRKLSVGQNAGPMRRTAQAALAKVADLT